MGLLDWLRRRRGAPESNPEDATRSPLDETIKMTRDLELLKRPPSEASTDGKVEKPQSQTGGAR